MNLDERNTLRRRSVQISISLPLTLVEVVDRYGESVGLGTSDTVADLIRDGLKLKAAMTSGQASAPLTESIPAR